MWLDKNGVMVLLVRGPVNFLTFGLVKNLIEYEIDKTARGKISLNLQQKNATTFDIKVDDIDNFSDVNSDAEMIPDEDNSFKPKHVILDNVTCLS